MPPVQQPASTDRAKNKQHLNVLILGDTMDQRVRLMQGLLRKSRPDQNRSPEKMMESLKQGWPVHLESETDRNHYAWIILPESPTWGCLVSAARSADGLIVLVDGDEGRLTPRTAGQVIVSRTEGASRFLLSGPKATSDVDGIRRLLSQCGYESQGFPVLAKSADDTITLLAGRRSSFPL